MNIFKTLVALQEKGVPVAMVTVTDVDQSAPREAGARMLVLENGKTAGTVGGGKLEAEAIKSALAALEEGTCRKIKLSFDPSDEEAIMTCGGSVELFIEVFLPGLRVLIIGAGNVGERIASVCSAAGIPYHVADDRKEYANPERFPDAGKIVIAPFDNIFDKLSVDENTAIVIVTRGHEHDRVCLEQAIKTRARYIGMIGSKTKVAHEFRELEKQGYGNLAEDPRIYAPVGLQLGDKSPGQVAVSIVSEILKVISNRNGVHMRELLDMSVPEPAGPEDASWV
ncbi:MAG: XdhC family protein [Candidatus Eremiobacteraeota bacterium]|nr:XdhC family protein [Candidatus Eremiobacteraeota bacterium]